LAIPFTDQTLSPGAMADIHNQAFTRERPWTSEEFTLLIGQPNTRSLSLNRSFAVGRLILGELEILTLACAPSHQRQGNAFALLSELLAIASKEGGHSAFLEMAADNLAAKALYNKLEFELVGRRSDYYKRKDGIRCDALVLRKRLILS